MRFISQDPDLETVFRRIQDADYDLQPDFQRGEVWPIRKKRRLIDSILRGWHIPPIHLVARSDSRSDVLDGQQRLTAIRDFMNGEFQVDGNTEPTNSRIASLHRLRYAELPPDVARSFRKFTIRIFELVDFEPEEPHELFFRLNQPTSLTEAEKRNAFAGDTRNQVREVVEWATSTGLLSDKLGFSNARLAYHDMIARVLVTIDELSLSDKVTASKVTARYRSGDPFSYNAIESIKFAMEIMIPTLLNEELRPNKATLHSWLCLGAQLYTNRTLRESIQVVLPQVITEIEIARWEKRPTHSSTANRLIVAFQNRSTARVADVSSVILRDLVIWMFLAKARDVHNSEKITLASSAWVTVETSDDVEETLLSFAAEHNWGELEWA